MRLAILGGTSQIALDFVSRLAGDHGWEATLFSRRPAVASEALAKALPGRRVESLPFDRFGQVGAFDGVVNFVGVGDPARAAAMGASIFDVTLQFDTLALGYLQSSPKCRYVFLSSGAVYGGAYDNPPTERTPAQVPIHDFGPRDWYGAAKLHAECRHRALGNLDIVDVRVFNYFSRTQDPAARYLVTDALRAIRDGTVLQVTPDDVMRDFVHPVDFCRLLYAVLSSPGANVAVDCYSGAPVGKFQMLDMMSSEFGLRYEIRSGVAINATGTKPNYFSRNRAAERFGYEPSRSSIEALREELAACLTR